MCGFGFSLADIESGAATIVQVAVHSSSSRSFIQFLSTPPVVTFLQGLDGDNANIDLDTMLEQIAGTIHNFYDKEFERYASGISVQDCLRGCVLMLFFETVIRFVS